MPKQIPDHLDFVGSGWHPLLQKLHTELLAVSPTYSVQQVKEKYGTLRVYLLTGMLRHLEKGNSDWPDSDQAARYEVEDDAARALVRAAEQESARTCESCGNPGVLRERAWLKTLCDACAAPR
ncbi:TraR/DksA family transcriptional regulator [Actinomadura sp. WMMB 499]|uniref:TraR/DksA family transcriptional regulator n=1 Tax=Actinomadura sp. WMMB 499 TaxID=1219491 RepID=UPI001244C7E9|nr:TraR/DksA family transcriptional regulator [Actinomadura sp. WMMB 499]QFG24493.1 TraR/DksA family transcriptional regulator [Actinomadura sp. WMMB 499]